MVGFWQWYYTRGVKLASAVYFSVLLIVYSYFSIGFLARTLFAPWRRDTVSPQTPNISLIFQAFWFNLIARLIGAIVRLLTIVAGIISLIFVAVVGAIKIVFLYTLPASLPIMVIGGLVVYSIGAPVAGLVLVGLAVIGGGALLMILHNVWQTDRWHNEPTQNATQPELSRRTSYILKTIQTSADLKTILARTPEIRYILVRAAIASDAFTIPPLPETITKEQLVATATDIAKKTNEPFVLPGHLFTALVQLDPSLQDLTTDLQLTPQDIENIVAWQISVFAQIHAPSPLTDPKTLRLPAGIGQNWAAGYTPHLEQFATELNELVARPSFDHQFIAHSPQIEEIERILARSGKHNVLLVGETGVGKRTTILGFARRVLLGKTLLPLRYKRILELDISTLLAQASNSNDLEAILVTILNEAVRAGNVILYIDDIERLLTTTSNQVGSINVSELLIPYLESSNFQLIATIPPAEYQSIITRQPTLSAVFEKITISEPDQNQSILVLEQVVPALEARHKLAISYEAVKEVVVAAARFLPDRKFPEKGIDLLDEISVYAASNHVHTITKQEVDRVLSQKTSVPIGEASNNEKEVLLHLEELLHKRVVNQVTAISAISNALRRARSGISSPNKPIGSFLFLGPTGVGKTETAKALAATYFGNETSLTRFDMSEYQGPDALIRLLGDSATQTGGLLTDAIRRNPFTCLLLDELEKASPQVLNIFLQVLDEGHLTDALGQSVDFRSAIIIATSNAGALWLKQQIEQTADNPNMEKVSKDLLSHVQQQGIFKPEFLNRFDSVVAFRPLNKHELEQVVDLQMTSLNNRLTDRNITLQLTPGARTRLAEVGFDPAFGARALHRAITSLVEDTVAKGLLNNTITNGSTVEITEEMIQYNQPKEGGVSV